MSPPKVKKMQTLDQKVMGDLRSLKAEVKKLGPPKSKAGGGGGGGKGPVAVDHRAMEVVRSKMGRTNSLLGGLFGQFLDPLSYTPVRLPDIGSPSAIGTALAVLSQVEQVVWPATPYPAGQFPVLAVSSDSTMLMHSDPNSRFVASLRDPVVGGIILDSLPGTDALPHNYVATFNDGNESGRVNTVCLPLGETYELDPVYFTPFGATDPARYGPIHPCGQNEGRRIVWIDACGDKPTTVSSTFFLQGPANYVGLDMNFVCRLHTGRNASEIYTSHAIAVPAQTVPATAVINLQASGYFSFSLNLSKQPLVTTLEPSYFQMTGFFFVSSIPLVHRHVMHPALLEGIVRDIRVLGNTLLVSQSTAEMFKSGQVYSKQVTQHETWYSQIATTANYTTTNVQEVYDGPLAKGLYAITKPQGESSLVLCQAVDYADAEIRSGQITSLGFRPFEHGGCLVTSMVPSIPNTTTPTTTLVLHFVRGIEYTTLSQLVVVNTATVPRQMLCNLLDELSKAKQFHENPLHLADVRNAVVRAGRWAWNNKSSIYTIAQMIAKLAAVA